MVTILLNKINESKNISIIRKHLSNDGLIIYPTDTLYGLGCNFFSSHAIKKIDKIKGRSGTPYSVIVSDLKMLSKITEINPRYSDIFINLFPGKITLITKLSISVNGHPYKKEGTVGVRIPDIDEILQMVEYMGFPIVSTSVNISSDKPLNNIIQIKDFIRRVSIENDLILIDGGDLPESLGSTIIDISKNHPEIIREGDSLNKVKKHFSKLNL